MLNVIGGESPLLFRKCKLLKVYGKIRYNEFYRFKGAQVHRRCYYNIYFRKETKATLNQARRYYSEFNESATRRFGRNEIRFWTFRRCNELYGRCVYKNKPT